ncbi:MAG: hypothetical protein MJ121_01895, partial [Clostridia bacterium]|nr:hypothetical protein [Clostridia bacterium]
YNIQNHQKGDFMFDNTNPEFMTYEEKQRDLYERQKRTLDLFLERNAISKEQYDKSLNTLKEKMNIK